MKRNITFIPLDPSTAQWLCTQLKQAPPNIKNTKELLDGLYDFVLGETSTLMLGNFGESNFLVPIDDDKIHIGDLEIYLKSRKVFSDGKDISLTPKEFDILYFLAKNRGEVFTKEQIYREVWEEDFLLGDSNIMAFIRKLRKKIEPNPDAPKYILTIWGVGYKFNDRL